MAFEQNQTIKTYKKIKLKEIQQNIQTKVELPGLKTVLSADGTAAVLHYDRNGENVNATGTATIKILYLNEDGNFVCQQKVVDFAFEQPAPVANYFKFLINETGTTTETTSQNEAIVTSKFSIETSALLQNEVESVKPGTNSAIEKTNNVQIQTISALVEDKLAVSFDTEITANSIVFSDAKVVLNSATATEDAVVVDGELLVDVLTELDGNLKQTYKSIEFSGEVAALGLKTDSIVDIAANVESFSTTLDNNGTNATLSIAATVSINGECYSNIETEIVEDAFCESNELIISTQGQSLYNVVTSEYKQKDIGIILQTKDKNVNMGTVLAVLSPKYENGNIFCTAIYRHAETDEIFSTIMYSSTEDCLNHTQLVVKSFAKKRTKEIMVELTAINLHCDVEENYITYASKIEIGANIESSNKGIIVYAARKGQELFDVAKSLNVNPNVLKEQNTDLCDIFQEDRKIIYYRPMSKQF